MKARHLLGGQATVLVDVSGIKGSQALCAHAIVFGLKLGSAHLAIAIGVERLESTLVKALGCDAAMLGRMPFAVTLMTLMSLMSLMPVMSVMSVMSVGSRGASWG